MASTIAATVALERIQKILAQTHIRAYRTPRTRVAHAAKSPVEQWHSVRGRIFPPVRASSFPSKTGQVVGIVGQTGSGSRRW